MDESRRPYHWWRIADIADFIAALNNAGPDDRMEFHPATSMLYVRSDDVSTQSHEEGHDDGFNFSHVCPPDCH